MTDSAKPIIQRRLVLHIRATGGSTYGHDLLDEGGEVIGSLSSWLGTGRNAGQSRDVFKLRDDPREFETFAQFREAYLAKLEQTRRDKEWTDAAPEGATK
ncbi:hypothetical protein [Bradyrhizobium sp. Ai1a-2]|uniref:hypothetical protein n=1 Tax=Bradyrhizobium sp. Ai1a-2 TaxID=196490 RepID=UPI0004136EEC|nr:hypothetical protein [Bradyrhizobium sp. Ai1a-2]